MVTRPYLAPFRERMKTMENTSAIYQFKVTLEDIEPAIWRRFLVPAGYSFAGLHHVLQEVMGWEDYHMFQFEVGRQTIAEEETLGVWEDNGLIADETAVEEVVTRPGATFIYEYDFGDGWRHKLRLESILDPEPDAVYPRVLEGERACPPEDSGGPWGYRRLLASLKDPDDPENGPYSEWVGEDFDPEAYDPAETNEIFAEAQEAFEELLNADITTEGRMTRPAKPIWDGIPEVYKKAILLSAWCDNCDEGTLLVDFHGRVVRGDLLLEGRCAQCGEPVELLVGEQ